MKLVHALCEYEYIEQANVMIPTYFISVIESILSIRKRISMYFTLRV